MAFEGAVGHSVNEVLTDALKFPLAEASECHGDSASGETVRCALDAVQVSGAGEQEPSGTTVGVHTLLDRQNQLRGALDLIDDQWFARACAGVEGQESCRVGRGGRTRIVVVHGDDMPVILNGDLTGQGTLADLAPALEDHDREIGEQLGDPGLGVAAEEGAHTGILGDSSRHRGFAGTSTGDFQATNVEVTLQNTKSTAD